MSIGKGIQLSTGFDLNAKSPLDNREWFKTIRERDSLPDINLYNGLKCYVDETKKNYQYIDGAWLDRGNGDSGGNTTISNASDIPITDANNNFEATNVEGALNELVDKIDNHTSPSGDGKSVKEIEYGTTEPTDENISIWVDTTNDNGVTSSFSDALIQEIMGAISNLNKQIADLKEKNKKLEERVAWLELNGGGSGGGDKPDKPDIPDPPIEPETNDTIMINERSEVLTFEDGSIMIFEVPVIEPETYDTVMTNENNEVLTFEDGTVMIFEIPPEVIETYDSVMVDEDNNILTFEDGSIMIFEVPPEVTETYDTIMVDEDNNVLTFEDGSIMCFDLAESISYDIVLSDENEDIFTFEDGTIMCFDINTTEVSIEMVNENHETLTFEDGSIMCFDILQGSVPSTNNSEMLIFEDGSTMVFEDDSIMCFSIEETFDTILINELEEIMMFENEDIMKF